MQVVRPEGPREPVPGVLAYSRPEVEQDPERERPGHAVDDARRDRVVEAEAQGEPAARAPAPRRVEDPNHRAEQAREDQVGRQAHALEQRSGHDRGRRPREQQEGQEEDQVDVVGQVRPEGVGPGDAALACDRGEVARVGADRRESGLVAVVDPPTDVVEGRRDDRDRQDVLHRRGEHVLAPHHAGLVGHEARVDEPHEHDREEVELLAQDHAVENLALGACRVLQAVDLRDQEVDHRVLPASPPLPCETILMRRSSQVT